MTLTKTAWAILLLLFTSLTINSTVFADEYRPAFLQLTEVQLNTFEVLWKLPVRSNMRPNIDLPLPTNAQVKMPVRTSLAPGALIEISTLHFDEGLAGRTLSAEGLGAASTEILLRIEYLAGTVETQRLTPSAPTYTVQGTPSTRDVISTYWVFGIEHILQGTDHLLFVACLIFIARTWRRILLTITGFTVAHSITLTLAALDKVQLPIPPIEAIIALSIVFLAREIIVKNKNTLTWRYPIVISSTFGLLHGFGFASALSELGLPQTEVPAALLAFNIGVECGQILFVFCVMLVAQCINRLFKRLRHYPIHWPARFETVATFTIGSITTFWTLQRISSFW